MEITVFLIFVLVLLIAAGVYLLFFKDMLLARRSRSGSADELPQPPASLIKVKSAVLQNRMVTATVEMSEEDYLSMHLGNPIAFYNGDDYDREPSILDQFLNPKTPREEKEKIAEQLRALGYTVTYNPRVGEDDAAAEADDREGGAGGGVFNAIASSTDQAFLRGIIVDPSRPLEEVLSARSRLAALMGLPVDRSVSPASGGAEAAPGKDEGEEDNGGGDGDGTGEDGQPDPTDEGYGSEEVNPDTHIPYHTDDYFSGADSAESANPAAPVEQAGDDGEVIKMTFVDGYNPGEDEARKAVALMTFILRSFRKELLPVQLVSFAESKLHLLVDDGPYWTAALRREGRRREAVYRRDPELEGISLDEFDLVAREMVDKAAEAASSSYEAPAEGEPQPQTEPVREAKSPFSWLFDAHGGKNDLMWARLENN